MTATTARTNAATASVGSWALDDEAGVRFCTTPVLVLGVLIECWRRFRYERRCPPCRAFTDRVLAQSRRLRGLP